MGTKRRFKDEVGMELDRGDVKPRISSDWEHCQVIAVDWFTLLVEESVEVSLLMTVWAKRGSF